MWLALIALMLTSVVFFLSRFPTQGLHNPVSADHPDYSFVCPVYVLWAHQKLCAFKVKALGVKLKPYSALIQTHKCSVMEFCVCFVSTVPHWSCCLQSDLCFWSLPWLFIATSIPSTSIYFWHSWVEPVLYIQFVFMTVIQLSQLTTPWLSVL